MNGICEEGEGSVITTLALAHNKRSNKSVLRFYVEDTYRDNGNLVISAWSDEQQIFYCPVCGQKL